MPDAIRIKAGRVETVARNTDDLDAFGSKNRRYAVIVPSDPPVCAGQLWDGERATDPPREPEPKRVARKTPVETVLEKLVDLGVITTEQMESVK